MPFLKNTWYVAGWASEVKPDASLGRKLLNTSLIFWRDESGAVRAAKDYCPHRFAPLTKGEVRNGKLICGYHGLEFGGAGACIGNPHNDASLPRNANLETFPVVEQYSLLWIWFGEPANADPALIPDFHFFTPSAYFVGENYLHVKAPYELEIENIMDLSHIQFLHPTTLGSGGVSSGEYKAFREGDTVWSIRTTTNDVMPDFMYEVTHIPHGTRCDRWIDVRWNAPACMALFGGAVPHGAPRPEKELVGQIHAFTPETENTTHYFFGLSFPREMGEIGGQLASEQIKALSVPFETEDSPMLEAQFLNMQEFQKGGGYPVILGGDAGGVIARGLLKRMIDAEAG